MSLADLRREYERHGLSEADAAPEPRAQFTEWFAAAQAAGVMEPNAMVLATVDAAGTPSARVLLLKGLDERGFAFFTNLRSRKASDLSQRPRAAMVFFWPEVERQVRVEGRVEPLPDTESDAYFATRPRESQLGAWASEQSREIGSRAVLEDGLASAARRFAGDDVPRPPHWGGYVLVPERVEFWQGRPARLHDRLVYVLEDGAWKRRRLAP